MELLSPYEIVSDFTHLHVHSKFSIRDGLHSPQALVDQAKKIGFKAMAITDHGNMGGHYQFAKAAAATKTDDGVQVYPIKPIFGIEAYLCDDIHVKEHIIVDDGMGNKRSRRPKHYHILLLAKDEQGYSNLKEITHASALDGFYYEPRIDWNLLEKYHEGIICSSACLAGEVAFSILEDEDEDTTRDIIDKYKQLFNDDFYLEVQWHKMDDEKKAYSKIMELADQMNVKLIATNDVHYTLKEDAPYHDIFVSMRFKRDEEQGGSSDVRNLSSAYKDPEFFIKTREEMEKAFHDRLDAVLNTQEVVDKCVFQYPLDDSTIIWPECKVLDLGEVEKWQQKNFPELTVKQAFLLKKSMQGLKKLGLSKKKEYIERLKYEWNVIFDLGYEEYFITQLMVCDACEERNILIGPGRGSATGSLALYTLGITKLDPLQQGLIFERFLNPGRGPGFDHKLPIMKDKQLETKKKKPATLIEI